MKKLLLLLFVSSLFAQNGVAPLPNSKPQFFTRTGLVCSGCKLYSYSTGTVNRLQTYTDSSGTVQNTNPITMGSDGRPPQEIWLGAFSYDIELKDASNADIYTVKNISVPNIQALTQASLTVTGPVILSPSIPSIASSSPVLEWDATYSNGTSILTDKYQCSNIPAAGNNPATVLTCNHTGSSGGGSVLFNFPLSVTGLTTQTVSETSPAFISSTANPAAAGVVRLASSDLINFRNNANSGDLTIAKTGPVSGLVAADTLNLASFGGLLMAGPLWGINSIATDVTHPLTLPAATDTLVGRATTDTLTNKTLTSPTITNPSATGTDSGTERLQNKRTDPRAVTLADATSVTLDSDNCDQCSQANTQAVGTLTVNAPSGTPVGGQKMIWRLKSTNVQTFAWNAIFRGSTTTPLPTTSSGASKTDYYGFIFNAADSKWDVVAVDQGH